MIVTLHYLNINADTIMLSKSIAFLLILKLDLIRGYLLNIHIFVLTLLLDITLVVKKNFIFHSSGNSRLIWGWSVPVHTTPRISLFDFTHRPAQVMSQAKSFWGIIKEILRKSSEEALGYLRKFPWWFLKEKLFKEGSSLFP